MFRKLGTAALMTVLCMGFPCRAQDQNAAAEDAPQGFQESDTHAVRVLRQKDGSRTEFKRSPDNKTITRSTYAPGGRLEWVTVYRTDQYGNPLNCKVYDGKKVELYKVSYGYRRDDGRLVEERIFDSRMRREDPRSGVEMPVRRFIYMYDAEGKRSKPVAITLIPGRTAKEVFGPGPTAYETNPFTNEPIRQRGQ